MLNQEFKNSILQTLKQDSSLWTRGALNESEFLDKVINLDKNVLDLLLTNEIVKNKFFKNINSKITIFNKDSFILFWQENQTFNSYTRFLNKIGLGYKTNNRFVADNSEVVLNFPFKDCVLKGDQSEEDIKNNNEIFYHEVIAQDEIDRLFEEKALDNFQKIDKIGRHSLSAIKSPPPQLQSDNLLIKGNNLIALHSLRKLYANQIDLIYIDPPYNTNNDTFAYNDRFNHSTWLTFIKNRIEVAKSLLKETGIIFISIDENEQAYLRILCDEIFGKLNLVNQFIWVNNLRGRLISNTGAARTHEYILVYAKNINSISEFSASPQLLTKLMPDTYKGYNHEVKRDEFGEYIITNELHNSNSKFNEKTRPNLVFDIYYKPKTGDIKCEDVTNNHLHHGYEKISPHPNIKCAGALYHAWRWGRERILKDSRELEFVNTNHGYKIYTKRRNINKATIKDLITNITTDSGSEDLSKLIPDTQINHPKPISLLNILLQCMKSDGIILDFFAGSGTTGDATLKLNKEDGGNRKFILIEQLDEHVEICKQRLQKVLERENINDSVIYFELAKFNRIAKEKINNCQNLEELINLFDELYSQYFLHYNLQVSEFKNEIKADDFKNLSLEEQKKCFVSVLDLNQMYINKSEMDDAKFNLSEDNKKLTNQFYNQNETKFI